MCLFLKKPSKRPRVRLSRFDSFSEIFPILLVTTVTTDEGSPEIQSTGKILSMSLPFLRLSQFCPCCFASTCTAQPVWVNSVAVALHPPAHLIQSWSVLSLLLCIHLHILCLLSFESREPKNFRVSFKKF